MIDILSTDITIIENLSNDIAYQTFSTVIQNTFIVIILVVFLLYFASLAISFVKNI